MPTAFPSVSPVPQSLPLISSAHCDAVDNYRTDRDDLRDDLIEDQSSMPSMAARLQISPGMASSGNAGAGSTSAATGSKNYHRIAEVRVQQGLSLRTISRRTGLDVKELRRQEQPNSNLTLSQLQVWQKALEVPLVDLLEDESDVLSRPVKERAQMVRIMKTVVSLGEVCQTNVRLSRLTTMLREQILQLMPELAEIGGWPQCGSRRGPDVMGRIFHDPVKVDFDGD